jgi:hypothetical protein
MKNEIILKVNGEKKVSRIYQAVLTYVLGKGEIVPALVARTEYKGLKLPSESGRRCRELVEARYLTRDWVVVKGVAYKKFWLTKIGQKALREIKV